MPLTAKQSSFIQYYADPASETYNNATQSMIKAGYSDKYAERNTTQVKSNKEVKAGIEAYKAKTSKELDHNRQIAIDQLTHNLELLDTIIAEGKGLPLVQAIKARTEVTKELNAISNLHSSTLNTEAKQAKPLTEDQQATAQEIAKALTGPKLHKDTG
jgi:phage terminase small subunit